MPPSAKDGKLRVWSKEDGPMKERSLLYCKKLNWLIVMIRVYDVSKGIQILLSYL